MTKVSISRAWDETRAVLGRDGKLFVAVGLALFVLPGLILNLVVPAPQSTAIPRPGVWIVAVFAALVISLIAQLSVIRLAMEPHVTVGEAIAHAARRFLSYLASVLLWMVPLLLVGSVLLTVIGNDPAHPSGAASLGLLALTVVGVFITVRLLLGSAVASAEAVGPIGILRRSWALSSGNWWRLFGFLALFVIAAFVLIFAIEAVGGLVAQLLFGGISPLSVGGLLVSLLAQLVTAFVAVILFVMLARIYAQLAGAGAEVSVPSSGT